MEAPRPYSAGNAIGKPHSGIAPCARGLCIFARPALRPLDIQAGVNGGFPQRESTPKDVWTGARSNILGKWGTRLKRGHPDRFGEGAFSEGRHGMWLFHFRSMVERQLHSTATMQPFSPNFPLAGSMAVTLLIIAFEQLRRLCHRKRMMLFP